MSASAHGTPTGRPADPGPATLLVFTLGAEAEGRRRRLLPARFRPSETALYRACLEEALAAGREAGCRLEVSSPRRIELPEDARATGQRGSGFGERFAHAFDSAFGHHGAADRPLVAVGTDTPGLRAAHLRRAAALLAEDPERVVIGPSPDGGLYLLAAARPLGNLLRRVRWCRPSTLGDLRRTLTGAGLRVELLDPLADLDRRDDLERWLARGPRTLPAALLALLERLLAALRQLLLPAALGIPRRAPVPVRRQRGPPRRPSI